jgi:hypothetical protein
MSWKAWLLWGLTAVAAVVAYLLVRRRPSGWPPVDGLAQVIEQTRLELTSARHKAAVEIVAANRDDAKLRETLALVQREPDAVKRRQRMLELYREVGGA